MLFPKRPTKVLLFGYINMNVIDGSSFFLSSLSAMLATDPAVEVDLLLANPVKRTLVYQDLFEHHNISIIDPFAIDDDRFNEWTSKGSLDYFSAAKVIEASSCARDYDLIIIRSTEVAVSLARAAPQLAGRVMLYVTGVVNSERQVSEEVTDSLRHCARSGMTFLCQTPEMGDEIEKIVGAGPEVICLPPMIPDVVPSEVSIKAVGKGARKFVYTGKFAKDWNPIEIVSGFLELQYEHPDAELTVAGDQFRKDDADEKFVEKIKFLLSSSPGVNWMGGIERERARRLIVDSDVGISWRSPALDSSLELSTKLLEYGSFGRPCIMNRTPMHERLFGRDYPLFANTQREFVQALETVIKDEAVYEKAARRSLEVAINYTYSVAFRNFLPHLISHVARVRGLSSVGVHGRELIQAAVGAESLHTADGVVYADMRRVDYEYLIGNAPTSFRRVGHLLAAIGPIAAFGAQSEYATSGVEEVLYTRSSAVKAGRQAGVLGAIVNSQGPRSDEMEILKGSLQRVHRDLEKAKRQVTVDVGLAHREFRLERAASEKRHRAELDQMRGELSRLQDELTRLRNSRGRRVQIAYWRLRRRLGRK